MPHYHLDACITIQADSPEQALDKLNEQLKASMLDQELPYEDIHGEVTLGESRDVHEQQLGSLVH